MRNRHLAAFLGGHVFSSSLLCSVEGDDPNGAGGAPAAATPPAPATPASPPTFTAEQLTYIEGEKAKAANAAAAAARRAEQGKKPAGGEPAPQPRTESPAPASDAIAILKLRDDFDDAISDLTLTGAQKKFMREHIMEKRPADVAGYVRTFADTLGLGKSTTPAPAATTAAPTSAPQGAPVTSTAAPANPTTVTDDTPLLRLSDGDRQALLKRIGIKAYTDRMFSEFRANGTRVSFRK